MDISDIKKAHFIGVSGIGVSAILRLLHGRGVRVAGSDVTLPMPGTLPEGTYHEGHNGAHLAPDTSVVIFSPAVPAHNPERLRAKELGIPELSYPEALALVTKGRPTIAVSGTHGKSTTTALLGKLFEEGGYDASVIVGAEVDGWDHNYRHGNGDMFIVEACEYRRHMMNLSPQAILLTNLELDHPDYYRDLADIKQAFREYIEKLSGEDLLIYNADDNNLRDITNGYDAITVRYGIGEGADLYARNIIGTEAGQSFDLVWKGTPLGNFTTPLPGLYNVYNILASVATYLAYSGDVSKIQRVLSRFNGVGRRFEVLGNLGNAIVISDYAHHPTALSAVMEAGASRYKNMRILTVFRPHHRERTIKLFGGFVSTLLKATHMILIEIYDVAGREEGVTVSSKDLITEVHKHDPRKDIVFAEDLVDAEEKIRSCAKDFDVVMVIGAGDADVLARKLITNNR